jgi:hypothetical protein
MITYMSTSKNLLPVLPFSLLEHQIIHYMYCREVYRSCRRYTSMYRITIDNKQDK